MPTFQIPSGPHRRILGEIVETETSRSRHLDDRLSQLCQVISSSARCFSINNVHALFTWHIHLPPLNSTHVKCSSPPIFINAIKTFASSMDCLSLEVGIYPAKCSTNFISKRGANLMGILDLVLVPILYRPPKKKGLRRCARLGSSSLLILVVLRIEPPATNFGSPSMQTKTKENNERPSSGSSVVNINPWAWQS